MSLEKLLQIPISEGVMKKSKKLVKDDKIQEVDETYFVAGSKEGDIYQVDVDEVHGLVCRKTNASEPNDKGSLCMGWKNSHAPKICSHSYAVVLFKNQKEKQIR